MSDPPLTSPGSLLGDVEPVLLSNQLYGAGVLLADGALLTDGVLLGDGVLLSDGVLLADVSVQANQALVQGDDTASMGRVVETSLPPSAPSGLKAAAASKTQINLTWADNSSDETGFKVERSTDGVTYTQLAALAANSKSYASTSLTGGKKYYYRVRAYNADGNSAYTAVATATTPTK
jgi:predicted phage tail protein